MSRYSGNDSRSQSTLIHHMNVKRNRYAFEIIRFHQDSSTINTEHTSTINRPSTNHFQLIFVFALALLSQMQQKYCESINLLSNLFEFTELKSLPELNLKLNGMEVEFKNFTLTSTLAARTNVSMKNELINEWILRFWQWHFLLDKFGEKYFYNTGWICVLWFH